MGFLKHFKDALIVRQAIAKTYSWKPVRSLLSGDFSASTARLGNNRWQAASFGNSVALAVYPYCRLSSPTLA